MQVQIIESNRGAKVALHDGHSYNQKQSTNNCIHWRCTKYYKLKCPAILKTKSETVIETKGTHNHECDPGECKAKKVVNQIKGGAEYSTPTVANANEIYEISDDYAVQLAMPKKDNLLRAVSPKRQKAMCLQVPAPTDRHFDVPDEFAPFLLQDSGKDDKERILIFGDVTMKNLLNLSNTWLVDGTFKLSPEIFYQNYTIHVELNGFAPPCVYVLLPNKTEKTYNRMIEMLSEETNPNPGKILADFEKAALNAFSKKFPHAEISCCYFQKMQKFKYVQETAGVLCSKRPRYEKIKKQMQNIRSTYEFENAVPYLRAVAKFR